MMFRAPFTDADCVSDAAPYVLGSLEPAEAETYERHLTGCPVCGDEVSTLRQVVEALAMAVPQRRLPTSLRRRVLRAVRAA